MLEFINNIDTRFFENCFAIAVHAGQVSNTLVQLKKELKDVNINLNSGFEIKTPSNYFLWGGSCPEKEQEILFQDAEKKIDRITTIIEKKISRTMEKGPLWQRIIFTRFYKMSFNKANTMDDKFWVDDKCNSCTTCANILGN